MRFSRKYNELKNRLATVQSDIDNACIDGVGIKREKLHLLVKKSKITDSMNALLNKNTQEKAFTKYAKRLFNISVKAISNNLDLSKAAIDFEKISTQEKQAFGQKFLDVICMTHKITPVSLCITDDTEGNFEADYDDKLKLIRVKDGDFTKTLDLFIGEILHEFTHHIYWHKPTFGPLTGSQTRAAIERGYGNPLDLEKYKQTPIESPAYFVQEYFEKNKFANTLMTTIVTTQKMIASKYSK